MKPIVQLASTTTPDGQRLTLSRHDRDYHIAIERQELMSSRAHESELELARLGCARLDRASAPAVFIGGLGMGYTLRQTLDLLPPAGRVVVVELLPDVIAWNRDLLGALNGQPLSDPRVIVTPGDAVAHIGQAESAYDAILLDIDNGPAAMTTTGNGRIYSRTGLHACRRALRPAGCLAIWSAAADAHFDRLLRQVFPHVLRFRAPPYKGARSLSRYIWTAAMQPSALPEPQAVAVE